MTKRNLLLVSLVLVFGLATASSLFAQIGSVFDVSNNTNYDARNEGDAEGVGTVTMVASANGTIKASSYIAVDYNVPIAHNGDAYAVGITVLNDTNDIQACMTVSFGTYRFHSTPSYPPLPGLTGNEIYISFTCDVFPTQGTSINVASRVMVQGYKIPFTIAATVRANSAVAGVPLTVTPGYDQAYIVGDLDGPATTVTFKEGPEYVLTCIGAKEIWGTSYDDDFELNIAENWNNALTSLSDEITIENNDSSNFTSGSMVWPTNGSNILITLFHIPPNVTINALTPIPCQDYDPSAAGYCATGNLVIEAPVTEPATTGTDGLGVQSFWYVVDATNTGTQENANFGFTVSSKGPLAPNQNYQITAQVQLTDDYPSTGPAEMPYFTLPENQPMSVVEFKDCVTKLLFPYVDTYNGGSGAFSNWGTGLVVANTTLDPFALPYSATVCPTSVQDPSGLCYPDEAKGSATPQSGSCVFYLYPWNPANQMSVYVTPNIPVGGTYAYDVASGGSVTGNKITLSSGPMFTNQQGYAIAICNFQNAHGFAFIYDNYVAGAPTVGQGYLAEVLPDPAFYRRSPAGGGLGEGAVAPLNINRVIQKFLLYGFENFLP